jgi:hypothetical protein
MTGFKLKGFRGPKPGSTLGRKRKQDTELSANPHTKRGRERLKNMDKIERAIANAKNADRQAINRALHALKKSLKYQKAGPIEQEQMREQKTHDILQER